MVALVVAAMKTEVSSVHGVAVAALELLPHEQAQGDFLAVLEAVLAATVGRYFAGIRMRTLAWAQCRWADDGLGLELLQPHEQRHRERAVERGALAARWARGPLQSTGPPWSPAMVQTLPPRSSLSVTGLSSIFDSLLGEY